MGAELTLEQYLEMGLSQAEAEGCLKRDNLARNMGSIHSSLNSLKNLQYLIGNYHTSINFEKLIEKFEDLIRAFNNKQVNTQTIQDVLRAMETLTTGDYAYSFNLDFQGNWTKLLADLEEMCPPVEG